VLSTLGSKDFLLFENTFYLPFERRIEYYLLLQESWKLEPLEIIWQQWIEIIFGATAKARREGKRRKER
jgi:hypothetical protein